MHAMKKDLPFARIKKDIKKLLRTAEDGIIRHLMKVHHISRKQAKELVYEATIY